MEFKLPNEYSHVGYLLDAIEITDASLQAAMAFVCNDDDPTNGKRSSFEATETCLLPHDPVVKKRHNNPVLCNNSEISTIDSTKLKSGMGVTGVNLRYHKRDEYLKITTEQKKELHVWLESSAGYDKMFKDDKSNKLPAHRVKFDTDKWMKRMISSAIAEERTKGKHRPSHSGRHHGL